METEIVVEGVSRKNIPWNTFCSIYLSYFKAERKQELIIESMKELAMANG